ncbi:MAG TPA: DnaJ family domain-containing protein [Acidimicrobiales bacterium]|jgi:hypothetical protein
MTDRKPPHATWESWIDRQIRAGLERGAFDDLPGRGKRIAGLDQPSDAPGGERGAPRSPTLDDD